MIRYIIAIFLISANAKLHPEAKLEFLDYCKYFGYPAESHVIQTEDGYLLTFFRIQAKGSKIVSGKPVVLLQHGLLDSSDTWIVNDEDKAPAFLIANRGYDVWLGNNRGNVHSRKHVKLHPFFAPFWDFTLEDFAIYDLPAGFKYINDITKQKIRYLGHSQGTTQMHIHLSLFKQSIVRDLMLQFIGFGPVAFVTTKHSVLVRLLDTGLVNILDDFGLHEFAPGDTFISTTAGRLFCGLEPLVCGDLIGSMVSADPKLDNYARYDVLSAHAPGGTSTKNLKHWKQFVKTQQFGRYDYGKKENLKRYGTETAPLYDLGNVDISVFYIAGYEDLLAPPKDVNNLVKALVNSPKAEVKFYEAGHCSFMWGIKLEFLDDLWQNLLL